MLHLLYLGRCSPWQTGRSAVGIRSRSIWRWLAGAAFRRSLQWWTICATWTGALSRAAHTSYGELGKDIEDSLVIVCGEAGCELVVWESLVDSCGSLRSEECLWFTLVCLAIGISRSGSVTSSLKFLLLFLVVVSHPHCLAGMVIVLLTGLSSNLVFLACLLSWTINGTVSETKAWDVLFCLTFVFGSERTVFELSVTLWLVSCFSICTPFRTKFLLLDGLFISAGAEGTKFCCKKEACIIGMSGLFGLMWDQFLLRLAPVVSTFIS